MRTYKGYLFRACYNKGATITYFWQRLKGRQRRWKDLKWKRKQNKTTTKKSLGISDWRLLT